MVQTEGVHGKPYCPVLASRKCHRDGPCPGHSGSAEDHDRPFGLGRERPEDTKRRGQQEPGQNSPSQRSDRKGEQGESREENGAYWWQQVRTRLVGLHAEGTVSCLGDALLVVEAGGITLEHHAPR